MNNNLVSRRLEIEGMYPVPAFQYHREKRMHTNVYFLLKFIIIVINVYKIFLTRGFISVFKLISIKIHSSSVERLCDHTSLYINACATKSLFVYIDLHLRCL